MKKVSAAVLALSVAALVAPSAFAAPCGASLPMFHGLDSYLACDNSRGPVTAYAYQLANPLAIHTGTENIASNLGPNTVQIQTDWGNSGIAGCPVVGGVNTRVIVVVQANDGSGALLSLSGADAGVGYLMETAHTFDPSSGLAFPVPCTSDNGRPRVNSVDGTSVNINVQRPRIQSDCDPDSVGVAALGGSTCPDNFAGTLAAATIGGIYTRTQACGTKPDTNRTAWVRSTVNADAAGNAVIPYTKPTAATDCAYVGTTTTINGVEGGQINGYIQIQGGLAAPPTAEGVRAATDAGKVNLSWSTSNEVGLAGFRLIAVSKTKGQFEIGSLIAAKGSPSSYTAEARMGDLKGSRSIIIRSILTDGTSVDAAPVNF